MNLIELHSQECKLRKIGTIASIYAFMFLISWCDVRKQCNRIMYNNNVWCWCKIYKNELLGDFKSYILKLLMRRRFSFHSKTISLFLRCSTLRSSAHWSMKDAEAGKNVHNKKNVPSWLTKGSPTLFQESTTFEVTGRLTSHIWGANDPLLRTIVSIFGS